MDALWLQGLDTPVGGPALNVLSSGPTISTAVSLANAQNTGKPNAGSSRAKAITQILGASAATVLAKANISRIEINRRLRSKREK